MAPDLAGTLQALDRPSPVEGLERGRLRPIEVAAQSIAAAAPTAGLVTTPSLVHATGAPAATAMVLATVLIMLVASSINQFTRRLAAPGSLYTFVVRGLGPLAGLVAAGALAVGYLFVSLSSAVGATSYLARSIGFAVPSLQTRLPQLEPYIAVALMLGVGILLLIGVRRATVVMLVIEVIAIGTVVTALVIAAVVGLGRLPGSVAASASAWTLDAPPSALVAATVIALSAFIGFESSSALGAEAQRPMRTLPRVITWTAVGVGVLFTFGTLVQSTAFAGLGLAPSANPVDDILAGLGLTGMLPAFDIAVMASFLACATASMMALVRLILALAIDGVLAAALGRAHPRWRTPHRAALILLPVLCGVPAILLGVGVPVQLAMDHMIQASVVGYLVAYLLVCASVLRFLPRIGESTVRPMLVAAAGFAGLLVALVVYLAFSLGSGVLTPAIVIGVSTVLAVCWWWWVRRRHPETLGRLGSYDQPSTASVWWGPSP